VINAIFPRIADDPRDEGGRWRALAADTNSTSPAAIDQFESRVGFMAARGVDTGMDTIFTSFGRGSTIIPARIEARQGNGSRRWWRGATMMD